jgi:hypothetical protein
MALLDGPWGGTNHDPHLRRRRRRRHGAGLSTPLIASPDPLEEDFPRENIYGLRHRHNTHNYWRKETIARKERTKTWKSPIRVMVLING